MHLNPQRQSNLEAETSDCAWTILSGLTRAVCLLYFRHYFGLVLTTSPCIQTLLLIPHVSEAFVKRSSVHLNSDRADAGYAAETPSASTRNTSINMIISIHNASLLRRSCSLSLGPSLALLPLFPLLTATTSASLALVSSDRTLHAQSRDLFASLLLLLLSSTAGG